VTDESQPVIRPAGPDDARELAAMLAVIDDGHSLQRPSGEIARALEDQASEVVLVAETGSGLAGFATLQLSSSALYARPEAELTNLFVREEDRRRGVGRALIREAMKRAEGRHVLELFLRVNRANHTAVQFYRQCALDEADHLVFRVRYYDQLG